MYTNIIISHFLAKKNTGCNTGGHLSSTQKPSSPNPKPTQKFCSTPVLHVFHFLGAKKMCWNQIEIWTRIFLPSSSKRSPSFSPIPLGGNKWLRTSSRGRRKPGISLRHGDVRMRGQSKSFPKTVLPSLPSIICQEGQKRKNR